MKFKQLDKELADFSRATMSTVDMDDVGTNEGRLAILEITAKIWDLRLKLEIFGALDQIAVCQRSIMESHKQQDALLDIFKPILLSPAIARLIREITTDAHATTKMKKEKEGETAR